MEAATVIPPLDFIELHCHRTGYLEKMVSKSKGKYATSKRAVEQVTSVTRKDRPLSSLVFNDTEPSETFE
jgi:hypothetical protein